MMLGGCLTEDNTHLCVYCFMLLVNRALGSVKCQMISPMFQTHNLDHNIALQSWCLAVPPQGLVHETDVTTETWLCHVF